jgi:hypothetical protein
MPARQNEERAPMIAPWLRLASDTTLLAFEAQTVIGLRLGQIATGRGTPAETQLMVTEKVLAFAEAAATVATGGSVHKIVKDYRQKVRADTQRLREA